MPTYSTRDQVAARYDEFQSEAVENVLADFRDKPAGRYLLVIPTGGGKTHTAAKAISRLFEESVLDPTTDEVVWVAHREELIKQARTTFAQLATSMKSPAPLDQIKIMMISSAADYLAANTNVRIVVIDEAHHAAGTNIQYAPLFDYPRLGILGLTATPSRHDGQPLEFDKESYSIGFPDLVQKQIIISPEVRSVRGGHYESVVAEGATKYKGLDALNDAERDGRIIEHITKHVSEYKKIVIYVGSVAHAKSLYERIRGSSLAGDYESIDYITGNGRSGSDATRELFFDRIKANDRAIIVNVDVLTEGYDDPTVNTIIMARPTRSKLVYMQAIGRCIRIDPDDLSKRAFIVEVDDELPNIQYRIDNRWLFSEISDVLEPEVVDEFYSSGTEFTDLLQDIYERYNVAPADRKLPTWDPRQRYSLLLFRVYTGKSSSGESTYRHIPILIDSHLRPAVSSWFNFLSERMQSYESMGMHFDAAMRSSRYELIPELSEKRARKLVYEAMEQASIVARRGQAPESERIAWITFVALREKKSGLPADLLAFLSDMVNREAITRSLLNKSHPTPAWLIRLPLPLIGSLGILLDEDEFNSLEKVMSELRHMQTAHGSEDHRSTVREYLSNVVVGLPTSTLELLPGTVRSGSDYFYKIS
jgi:superfamily II DNA or RNA helicase